MMDKKPKKELIDGLRDFLRDFEESYDHREWEHFQKRRDRKRRNPIPLFIKLAGVAASLFLVVYASVRFIPFFERIDEKGEKVLKRAASPTEKTEQPGEDTLIVDTVPSAVGSDMQISEGLMGSSGHHRLPDFVGEEEIKMLTVVAPVSNMGLTSDSTAIEQPITKAASKTIPLAREWERKLTHIKPDQSRPMNFPDLWPLVDKRISSGDIRIGFSLNPVFTNKGFSLGGGVSAQIPLSRGISTEIGVDYMNLRVGMDMEADRADTISQQTIGIRNSVSMVAIPVSLNYSITGNFSASLGIVPFRVFRDQRTDIYQSYRWVGGDVLSGDTTRRLIGERTRSQRADSLYMGKTYLGFIRVSGHVTPPLLKKYNAAIAPFVAIPIGRLRDDEYRWLHGGVSLRVYLR